MAIQGLNAAAQAFGNLVPLKDDPGAAPAGAAPPALAADQNRKDGDVNLALKPGQAANITLEQPGPAAGGPGGVAEDITKALAQIKEQLDGLLKQMAGLFEKLGIKLPDGTAPAAGGPAGDAGAKPAAAAANDAAGGGQPTGAAVPPTPRDGAPGRDGRDGAAAPANNGQTIIITNQRRGGLLGDIHDFLFGAPQPQIITVGGNNGQGAPNVQVVGGGTQGGILDGMRDLLFGAPARPQVIQAGNAQVIQV